MTQLAPPVPGGYSFDVKVGAGGLWCGVLYYTYYPEADVYSAAPGFTVECTGTESYAATGPLGSIMGSCVPLP